MAPSLDEGRFEALDLGFHSRVHGAYADLAARLPGWVRIDAGQDKSAVCAAAIAAALPPTVSRSGGDG